MNQARPDPNAPRQARDHADMGGGEGTEHTASQRQLWLAWGPGTRVMIRRTLPAGSSHLFTDVLGTVVRSDAEGLRLVTRSGEVDVPGAEIAVGKPIPPAPERRRPRGAASDGV